MPPWVPALSCGEEEGGNPEQLPLPSGGLRRTMKSTEAAEPPRAQARPSVSQQLMDAALKEHSEAQRAKRLHLRQQQPRHVGMSPRPCRPPGSRTAKS